MKLYLYGEELEYNYSVEIYNEIRRSYKKLYYESIELTKSQFIGITGVDFEHYFKTLGDLHGVVMGSLLEMAVYCLFQGGLEYAEEGEFYDKYGNIFDCFSEDLKPLIEKCEKLNQEYHIEQEKMTLKKLSRGQWTGGGFGLGGAIKGAITAKALNLGSDLFYNTIDSGKVRKISTEYERKRDQILWSENTINLIYQIFLKECKLIADSVITELVETQSIEPLGLNTVKAKNLLINTLRFRNPTAVELKHVVVQCLRMDPFCQEIYDCLLNADGDNQEVIDFASYFGMITNQNIESELNKVYKMDESNWKAVIEKINAGKRWEEKYRKSIDPKQIERLFMRLRSLIIANRALALPVCEEIQKCFENSETFCDEVSDLMAFCEYMHMIEKGIPSNRIIMKTMDALIEIKKKYKGDVAAYVLLTFAFVDLDCGKDDMGIEELIGEMSKKYHLIIQTDQIVEYLENEFNQKLYKYNPINGYQEPFRDRKQFEQYLKDIYKVINIAARWSRVVQEQNPHAQIVGITRKVSQHLLNNTKYLRADSNTYIILPDEYKSYLQCAIEYVRGERNELCLKGENKMPQNGILSLSPADIVSQICESRKDEGSKWLLMGKDLPNEIQKCLNARLYYDIPFGEKIFLVFDASILGNCKDGFALSAKGLYAKKAKRIVFFSWQEFVNLPISKSLLSDLKIADLSFTSLGSDEGTAFLILMEIQKKLRTQFT